MPVIHYKDQVDIIVSQQMVEVCGVLKSMYEDCDGYLYLPDTKTISIDIIRAVDKFAESDVFPENIDLRLLANFAVYIDYPELIRVTRRRIEAYLQDKPIEYQYWWQSGTEINEDHTTLYNRNKNIFIKYYAPTNPENISFVRCI